MFACWFLPLSRNKTIYLDIPSPLQCFFGDECVHSLLTFLEDNVLLFCPYTDVPLIYRTLNKIYLFSYQIYHPNKCHHTPLTMPWKPLIGLDTDFFTKVRDFTRPYLPGPSGLVQQLHMMGRRISKRKPHPALAEECLLNYMIWPFLLTLLSD
jgi:hypothetical protein